MVNGGRRRHLATEVGRLAWTRRTSGRLRPRERVELVAQGVSFQLSLLPWQLTGPLGVRPRARIRTDSDRIRLPDTPAARAAEELCAEQRPHALVNHCYRTYLFGRILGEHDGRDYDDEALYVASLVHDLGLMEAHRDRSDGCFTLVGASAAERMAAEHGWSRARAVRAAEAVTLHMNLRLPVDSREAQLLAAGAQLDVLGAGYWKMDERVLQAVLRRFPRADAKEQLRKAFKAHARCNPGTRTHFYNRYLLMDMLIRRAPFPE